ncbi:hypothetical protein GCM10009415_43170 [Chitinophaga japonensis]
MFNFYILQYAGITDVSVRSLLRLIYDIVVLVGGNNVGKSSVLKAYELVMSQGSSKADLKLEDLPNNTIDPDNYPK